MILVLYLEPEVWMYYEKVLQIPLVAGWVAIVTLLNTGAYSPVIQETVQLFKEGGVWLVIGISFSVKINNHILPSYNGIH